MQFADMMEKNRFSDKEKHVQGELNNKTSFRNDEFERSSHAISH